MSLSKLRLILAVSTLLSFSNDGNAASGSGEGERVCGVFGLETALFEAWRDIANSGLPTRSLEGYEYQPIVVERSDRPSLAGYRVSANNVTTATRALLFFQGNAMRADQLRADLTYFADRGFDVFIFDYRGYGNSNGSPLLKPISLDQATIARFVHGKGYDKVFLYGISVGGIFALGPHMPINLFEAVAVDSSPAKLPWYAFCPSEYDPIANVPSDASNILVISGGLDSVIGASDVQPLGKIIEARGGKYRYEPKFGHPLMDSAQNTRNRFKIVADFFEAKD